MQKLEANGTTVNVDRFISGTHLQNYFKTGEPFEFSAYISEQTHQRFFRRGGINGRVPEWQQFGLTYDYSPSNERHFNLTIPVTEQLLQANESLNLHFQVRARNPFYISKYAQSTGRELAYQSYSSNEYIIFNETLSLIKYRPRIKESIKRNLLSDDIPMPKAKEEPTDELDDGKFLPYFKPELYLYLIYDNSAYQMPQGPPIQIRERMKIHHDTNMYEPIIYLSDYWLLKKDMVLINDTLPSLNLSLHFNTYSFNYYVMQRQFEQQWETQKQYGLESGDMDEMKRMFLETDPILLTVTMIVSLLHTVFEVLAFKNDINFWKTKDSMEGISVRTLYTQTFCSVIIFLYLFDNETSMMILASNGFGILLDFWKIKKASKVRRIDTFPYFALDDNQKYVESETKEYDRIAMRYMSYALFPMLVCYTIYSVLYNEHKGWYSFVLNTFVGAIYMFGFIQMTPQLYINYRLKTVEHMPSRALFYRFLNTIIDDLFSFIITMPTLHRLSCFRDDVIFFIYLYQRWAYKVDKTRGPYGSAEEKKEGEKTEAIVEGKEKTE
ncbi:hypothetical protein FGO68_gene13054 [Halteria grandinella]|uniref:Cleft lip and palate associated transmembrane protein n=1 Tax=Halteria grandinella TaxID=5974 RepID=A0A8J8T473_HALGN|nr:hypothetical protein FGO68_gene13054 [Halteria grandinella]